MGDVSKQICRLCLEIVPAEDGEVIEETKKNELEILFIPIDFDVSDDAVACSRCLEKLQECVEFKSLINVDTVVDNKNVFREWTSGDENAILRNDQICRLCMSLIDDESFKYTSDSRDGILFEMIANYLPKVDLNTVHELLICKQCQGIIKKYSEFKTTCHGVEQKIRNYCEAVGNYGKAVLKDVLKFMYCDGESTVSKKDSLNVENNGITVMECSQSEDTLTLKCQEIDIKDELGIGCLDMEGRTKLKEIKCFESKDTLTLKCEEVDIEDELGIGCSDIIKHCENADTLALKCEEVDIKDELDTGCSDMQDRTKLEEIKRCEDIVDWLLDNPFSWLNMETKLYVVETLGKPRPNLSMLMYSNGRQNRGFNQDWFDKCEWLTGSSKRQKLYCWSCLLFPMQTETDANTLWSKTVSDIKNFQRFIERHSRSKEHVASFCKITLFGKRNIPVDLGSTPRDAIISYNNQVRENRRNFKRLIDATIFLTSPELVNNENYKELLLLAGKYDAKFNNFLKNNIFPESKTIQNDLIDSLSIVLKHRIEKEIADASFFAWHVNESTSISGVGQLSIVFRYVKNGEVVERFIGFYDVSAGRTSEDSFTLLTNECKKYNFKDKLVAHTCDGAAVAAGHLYDLQNKIKSVAPHALFTHCHSHALNSVLSEACNGNNDCRIFFSNLSGFASFFSKSAKRAKLSNEICFDFTTHSVFTVHANREKLMEVFNFVIYSDDFKNDAQSVREAVCLKNHLNDPKFCFLLETFKLIFEQTDVLQSIVARKHLGTLFETLRNYRNHDRYFNNIYEIVKSNVEPPKKKLKTAPDVPDWRQTFKHIFVEILDIVLVQIGVRFGDLQKLNFLYLLEFEKFLSYTKTFPQYLLDDLVAQYPFFDKIQLRNELSVTYKDPQMFENCNTPAALLNFIFKNELHKYVPELYKFLTVVVTIPLTSASVETSFSALKRISSCNSLNKNQTLLSVEHKFLKSSCQDDQFYEDVIDHFANAKSRQISLLFKSE